MNGVLNIPYYIDDAHGWAIVTMTDLRKQDYIQTIFQMHTKER